MNIAASAGCLSNHVRNTSVLETEKASHGSGRPVGEHVVYFLCGVVVDGQGADDVLIVGL